MARRVPSVDWITIDVCIDATQPKWAEIIRGLKPHQVRIVSPVALAQVIAAGYRVPVFSGEPCGQAIAAGKGAIHRITPSDAALASHDRTLPIYRQTARFRGHAGSRWKDDSPNTKPCTAPPELAKISGPSAKPVIKQPY